MTRDHFLYQKIGLEWKDNEYNIPLSTWSMFGKLWEWAIQQSWWKDFLFYKTLSRLIHPDRFADAIARYLGWEGEK